MTNKEIEEYYQNDASDKELADLDKDGCGIESFMGLVTLVLIILAIGYFWFMSQFAIYDYQGNFIRWTWQ